MAKNEIVAVQKRSPIALVFGGTSGFGKGIAEELNSRGYITLALSRRNECDVRRREDLEYVRDVVGDRELAVVVYSAGLAVGRELVENGDSEGWRQVFETNVLGLLNVAQLTIPKLRESGGHLISIGSIAHEVAYAGAADYCASKAAQRKVMETLRFELLGSGIRQTQIEVGLGDTNFQAARYKGDMEKAALHYGSIRQLTPDDLGRTVGWILDQPAHVNLDSITLKPLDQAHHGHLASRGRH
jgi:NADP-dependent 3-hydroxy acid dehydrogenase YdfG